MNHLVFSSLIFLATLSLLQATEDMVWPPEEIDIFLQDHCYDCHDATMAEGDLDLEALAFTLNDPESRERWIQIFDRVELGEMPPPDKSQPDGREKTVLLDELGEKIVAAELQSRADSPGRAPIRRLNTTEFAYILETLFGPAVYPDLPKEEVPHGDFETEAKNLLLSEFILKTYSEAATRGIDAALARYSDPWEPRRHRLSGRDLIRESDPGRFALHLDGESLIIILKGYRGFNTSMTHKWAVPETGWYRVQLHGSAYQSDEPVPFRVRAGSLKDFKQSRHVGYGDVDSSGEGTTEFWAKINQGEGLWIYRAEGEPNVYRHARIDLAEWEGDALRIDHVEVEGPFSHRPGRPEPLLDRVLREETSERGRNTWIRNVLETVAPILLRVSDSAEQKETVSAALKGAPDSGLARLRNGLKALLLDPRFAMRLEGSGKLDGFALATRLSLALTGTLPDEPLLAAASDDLTNLDSGRLRREVTRLLDEPQSDYFYRELARQWFQLKHYHDTSPDRDLYPEWNDHISYSAEREPEEFLTHIIRKNRDITDLVAADYTFANRRLASFYGLEALPAGSVYEKVSLPENGIRGGIWTQASVQKLTANGSTTSPILRGVWVLENILGRVPPPPPPNISAVEPDIRGATTIREQLAKHNQGSCQSCHTIIDPWGFAMESFDPTGAFRTRYRHAHPDSKAINGYQDGLPIDSSGTLPDGSPFDDIRGIRLSLAAQPEQLARTAIKKIVPFVTGTKVAFADRSEVEAILTRSAATDHRMQDLLIAIFESPLITHR